MTIFDNSYNINRLIIESKRLNPDKYAIIYQNLIIEAKRIAPDKYAIIIQKAYKRFRCNILYRKKFIEQYEMLDNFKKHILYKCRIINAKLMDGMEVSTKQKRFPKQTLNSWMDMFQ